MINGVTLKVNVDDYILNTLKEDITSEDVSTNAVMPEDKQGKAELICKQDGIICGLGIFERTFELLDKTARFEAYFKDGDEVKKGELLGVIYGDIKAILSGERTGLNYLQRMSGIATMTREYMKELEGTNTTLLDTRKTTPNMRPFEKYAVKVGGATNHRYNLSDGVLLKDNHIGAAGSITKAIKPPLVCPGVAIALISLSPKVITSPSEIKISASVLFCTPPQNAARLNFDEVSIGSSSFEITTLAPVFALTALTPPIWSK